MSIKKEKLQSLQSLQSLQWAQKSLPEEARGYKSDLKLFALVMTGFYPGEGCSGCRSEDFIHCAGSKFEL